MVAYVKTDSKTETSVDDYGPGSDDEKAEYRTRLLSAREHEAEIPYVLDDGSEIGWAPQSGSQEAFLSNPVFELLAEGERAGGKSDALIMSFAANVGLGFGENWRGILFRQTYPQLADIVAKTQRWFPLFWGNSVRFNEQKMIWRWSSGEALLLRHMKTPKDYQNYHGHEYPWQGWEELTAWANAVCYLLMQSCCRSPSPHVPRMIRATTNPFGPGHSWVKHRWKLPDKRNDFILDGRTDDGAVEEPRGSVYFPFSDNKVVLSADPNYMRKVVVAARNKAERAAWEFGDWDVAAGGMFDEAWFLARKYSLIQSFEPKIIPTSWRISRSFDWGSSHPFSVGWWAVSDGTDLVLPDGRRRATVRGDTFRIAEWYGSTGKPNEGLRLLAKDIAHGIIQREVGWGIQGRVKRGPADSQIFTEENGNSIERDMRARVTIEGRQYDGVYWDKSHKNPGSRVPGWDKLREMLLGTIPVEGGGRDKPGLFVLTCCEGWLRTVPSLPRKDDMSDDADTEAEDHIADEVRYFIYRGGNKLTIKRLKGR